VAALLPDDVNGASAAITAAHDAARADVINVLEKRIDWIYTDFVQDPNCALGYLYIDPDTERIDINGVPPGPTYWMKHWMHVMGFNGFLVAGELGAPLSAAAQVQYDACKLHVFGYLGGLFGTYATSGHNWRVSLGAYTFAAALYDEQTQLPGPLYTSWATVWAQTCALPLAAPYSSFGMPVDLPDTAGLSLLWSGGNNTQIQDRGSQSFHTISYITNALYSLAIGYDEGHSGCIAAWLRLVGASNFYPKLPVEDLTHTYPAKIIRPRTWTP
jgi:hypothetical protein